MKKISFFILFSCKSNENEIERITKTHKIENSEEIKNIPEKISKNITITEQENYDFSKITKENLDKIPKGSLKEYFKNIFDEKNEKKDKNDIQENFKKLFIKQNKEKDDGRLLFSLISKFFEEKPEFQKVNKNFLELIKTLKNPQKKIFILDKEFILNEKYKNRITFEEFIKIILNNDFVFYIYKPNKDTIQIVFFRDSDRLCDLLYINIVRSVVFFNKTEEENDREKQIKYFCDVKNFEEKFIERKELKKNEYKHFDGFVITLYENKNYELNNFCFGSLNEDASKNDIKNFFEKNFLKTKSELIQYSRNLA